MYVNFEILLKRGLIPQDLLFLQAVKQQQTEDLGDMVAMLMDDQRYEFLIEKEYVKTIKGTSKMTEIEKIRLTTKGARLLDDIQTAYVTDEDIVLRDWLIKQYENEGKQIGNRKKIATGIAQFRAETGIEKNALAFLFKSFISDEENMVYNLKLEKMLFSSKSMFSTKFNINECRLHDYYMKRKNYFDKQFKKYE